MSNSHFQFKQFLVEQQHSAMKVTTDACLFGAWAAKQLKNYGTSATTLLDIGTGTGLLSLMIAQQFPGNIDAIEIDTETSNEATKNVTGSPWHDRINIINGDARNCIQSNKKYDVIISNPPFYEKELHGPTSKKNIAHHDSGLLLAELFHIISTHLLPHGNFFLMLPKKRISDALTLITENKFSVRKLWSIRQSPDHEIIRIFIHGNLLQPNSQIEENELIIRNEEQGYTDDFRALLKDYYLQL